jgi:hypothetical protein
MPDTVKTAVRVVGMTEAGIKVAVASVTATAFWLPRSAVAWAYPPRVGGSTIVVVPS